MFVKLTIPFEVGEGQGGVLAQGSSRREANYIGSRVGSGRLNERVGRRTGCENGVKPFVDTIFILNPCLKIERVLKIVTGEDSSVGSRH